jgi:hypothetical protein
VVRFTPRLLYPRGKSPPYPLDRRLSGPRASLDDMEEKKFLILPGLELRLLARPARSPSLGHATTEDLLEAVFSVGSVPRLYHEYQRVMSIYPNECLRHLPRRPLIYLTHLFNHCLGLSHFPKPWKEAKIITLAVSTPNSLKIYVRLILCDCEAIAYLRFRHLGQFLMEPSDFYDAPIIKVLHFIRSVGLIKS